MVSPEARKFDMAKPETTPAPSADSDVLDALRKVAGQSMTPDERHQQMVSFVMGTMSMDSTITREEVESILEKRGS